MLPMSSSNHLQYKVLSLHDRLEEDESGKIKKVVLGLPIGILVTMWVLDINYPLRMSLTVLLVSLVALGYACKVFVWIMAKPTGSLEM